MKNKEYILSLNVDTTKVGWVCLLPDNRILKYNDKLAMGVHEYREAKTAEERRLQRSNRRILARRKKRMQLTQEVFKPIIHAEHPDFLKIDELINWQNASSFKMPLSELLQQLDLNTKEYPTIFHLRNDLIHSDKKQDIRLVFLAVYNLIKKRGNFNFKGKWGENTSGQILDYWAELLASYEELTPLPYSFDSAAYVELDSIVSSKEGNKAKLTKVTGMFDKTLQPLVSAILDASVPLNRLFPISPNYGLYKENKMKLQLSSETFLSETLPLLTDDEQDCVNLMLQLQQMYMLKDILGDFKTVAEAKVHAYEDFANDLKMLKEAFDYIDSNIYRETFITPKANLKKYEHEPNEINFKRLSRLDRFLTLSNEHEAFYKFVSQVLSAAAEDVPNRAEILSKLERGKFLQKLKGRLNSSIPVQNNVYELQLILHNQQKHYPAITDEVIQKLVDIITFKIPFYVGPLDDKHSKHAWLIRKGNERITPFNFSEQIDLKATNEKWINTLIGDCSYLKGQKVLPNSSLLYEEYKLLNELNVIQFRLPNEAPHEQHRIPQEIKLWLLENVFKQKKKVTHKAIYKALEVSPYADFLYDNHSGEMKQIFGSGKPTEFTNALNSWNTFTKILGNDFNPDMVENLIYWLSVYSEEDFIKENIQHYYPFLEAPTVRQILNIKMTGWGNLSKAFINGIHTNSNGKTVIEALRSQCINISMLNKNLEPFVKKHNEPYYKPINKFTYDQVEDLAGSKAIKRGIWRCLKVIEEITAMFGEPTRIVLKVEREESKVKKRTKTRKEKWHAFGKSLKAGDKEEKAFFSQYAGEPDSAFRNDAFWLYLTQLGRCAFTGKHMGFKEAAQTHIYPRSMSEDGSLSNLVLVNRETFQNRNSGQMPLEMLYPSEAITVKTYWEQLRNHKLIDQTKYFRLLKAEITEEDRIRSHEQQLVERRQIVKNVELLIKQRFPNKEVYTVKNNLINTFRKKISLPKVKLVNTKYAAVDALLAGLLVQYSIRKYGHYIFSFDITKKEQYEQLKAYAYKYKENFFLFKDFLTPGEFTHTRTGEAINMADWLQTVNDEYDWQLTKMRGSDDASFYDQTLISPKIKEPAYMSPKTKFGVYNSLKKAAVYRVSWKEHFATGKSKEVINFVDITNFEVAQWKGMKGVEIAYLLAQKGKSSKTIDISNARLDLKLEKGQKVEYEGKPYLIVSSKELENAKPLVIPNQLLINHLELLKEKQWDNSRAILLFDTLKSIVMQEFSHILTNSNIVTIEAYEIKDVDTYLLAFNELIKACSCSPSRSLILNFGGRVVKKYKPEHLKVINESITGLKYKK